MKKIEDVKEINGGRGEYIKDEDGEFCVHGNYPDWTDLEKLGIRDLFYECHNGSGAGSNVV